MRRDKKAAKKKKSRELARRDARAEAAPTSFANALRLAHASETIGPAFMTGDWQDDALPPQLVNVVVTRVLPDGTFVGHIILVDRTCLGVKNAFSVGPLSDDDLHHIIDRIAAAHDSGVEPAPFELAQSVVFHALDYAASLGFAPHPDFDPRMLGARPAELVATPLAQPSRPFYIPGPDDDVKRIVAKLEAKVGPDGFDFGEADELDEPKQPDEAAFNAVFEHWGKLTLDDPRFDHEGAIDAYVHAVTGEPMGPDKTIDEEHMSSLPFVWGTLFRPLASADGKTGLELARASKEMARDRPTLDRLARGRAALFDVIEVLPLAGVATCRDVVDGSQLDVRLGASMLQRLTRWTRLFGYIAPMEDGSWYPPSALLGHRWLRNTELTTAVARLNELLATLGVAERVDPEKPSAGMTRFGALMHGVLHRSIAPTAEQDALTNAPIYLVNSDNERFEPHEAVIDAELALASTDDFVPTGGGFEWGPRRDAPAAREPIATVRPKGKGAFVIAANSRERFERLLVRLAALAGTKLEPADLRVVRPWELQERAIPEKRPGCRTLMMGIAADMSADAPDMHRLTLENIERALDDVVPLLGGRPRDLVADADGRRRVEEWLRSHELLGVGGDEDENYLDLDDVRADLGLPLIRD